jgi:hypothetical protein
MNRTDAEVLPGVTFEVERFEWSADDRLALVGRWFGLRGHRFLRPTLDVDVSGERRRMLADLEHKPWAADEGEEWIAEFRWRGEPAHFQDAELTVSPDLAVQLPQPDNSVPEAAPPERGERVPARPPRTALLEAELAAAAEELARVTGELTKLRDQQTEAAKAATAELDKVKTERDEAAAAHAQALGAAQRERDQAREQVAAVEQERDQARARLAAAAAEAQAAAEARDEARAERNAWMSRARAAALPPAPASDTATGLEAEAPAPVAPSAGADPSLPAAGAGTAAEAPEPPADPSPAGGHRPEPPVSEPLEPEPPEPDTAPIAAEAAPPQGRRTIRIGERPFPAPPGPVGDPLDRAGWRRFVDAWGPRLAALAALIVILAVVALVLAWAL